MKKQNTFFALLIIILLAGPLFAQLANSPCPKFHINNKNTGLSAYGVTPTRSIKTTNVKTNWKALTGAGVYSSPAIGNDGKIYVGSYDHYFYCFYSDGSINWKALTGSVIYLSSPAIGSDGKIYVGSADNYLYCFNPTNGKTNWKALTGNIIESSPAIGSDGKIYVSNEDHYLYCFNPDGSTNWKAPTYTQIAPSPSIGSPVIGSDGKIYVGSYDHYLYCFNPDGSTNWKTSTENFIISSTAIGSDGKIYVGSSLYLYCFSIPLPPTPLDNLNSLDNLNNVVIVPNPFKPNAQNSTVTFYNLTSDAEIKIYTVTGLLIVHLKKNDANKKYVWDGKDSHGKLLPAGIYMCYISNFNGQKKYLQLAIHR